jgi:hypothetical protein
MTDASGFQIAIPSYNRSEILKEKTLPMLHRYNIDPKIITVFVANKEEEEKYKLALPKKLYNSIVVGEKGVMNIRNFITNYYPEDCEVVSLDDDIDGFVEAVSKKESVPVPSLKNMIKRGFKLCKENGYHVWGIYPLNNPFYMYGMNPVSTDLKFLIGHCFGFINKKVLTHIDYKEDYERSLEYSLRDGGVIRFNHICALTKFGTKGGVDKSAKERIPTYNKEIEFLMNTYPGLVRKNSRREGEILLSRSIKAYKGEQRGQEGYETER